MKKTLAFTLNTLLILAFLVGISMLLIDTTFSVWILGITFIVFILKEFFFGAIQSKKH